MNIKKQKNKKGVTLLELIITMAVSSLIILAVVAVFASIIRNRNNVKKIQQNMENARSAIEYMSKSLRMACNIQISGGSRQGEDTVIYFANQSSTYCEKYEFLNGQISKYKCGAPDADTDICEKGAAGCKYNACGEKLEITPLNSFQNAYFFVDNNMYIAATDFDQIPIVTIKIETSDKIMQTSVSSRDYAKVKIR